MALQNQLSTRVRTAIRFGFLTVGLTAALVALPSALRAWDICYWTCYGYAQQCNPGDKAHVCCNYPNDCQVQSCLTGGCLE